MQNRTSKKGMFKMWCPRCKKRMKRTDKTDKSGLYHYVCAQKMGGDV